MTPAGISAVVFAGAGIGVWLSSFIVEALRRVPPTPQALQWAPDIPIRYTSAGGCEIRYIRTGKGPNLVLLHTLRTQLDLFQKIVPELRKHFTVYALDYPGHGYSDAPSARYDAAFFVRSVTSFLGALDLHDVTLAGVSIGASIALIIAASGNPRVARVVAINPYDYAKGHGIARSSWIGRMIVAASAIPAVGEMFMRLSNFAMFKTIMLGGVADAHSIPPELLTEIYEAGNLRGHDQAFLSLLRNSASWERIAQCYRYINVPVRLIWGDRDWARASERDCDRRLISGATVVTIKDAGHFLPLDKPDPLTKEISNLANVSVIAR